MCIDELDQCPECNSSWIGEEIPESDQRYFGNVKFFKRIIGISDFSRDCVTLWQCPDCSQQWDRFTNQPVHQVCSLHNERLSLIFPGPTKDCASCYLEHMQESDENRRGME